MTVEFDKDAVAAQYVEMNPTPETTKACVEELAAEWEVTVPKIRINLTKLGVYVGQAKASGASGGGSDKPKKTRRLKKDAVADLVAAIEKAGKEVTEEEVEMLGKPTMAVIDLITRLVTTD